MVSTTLFNPAFTFLGKQPGRMIVISMLSETNTTSNGNQNWETDYFRYISPDIPGEAAMNNYAPLDPYAYAAGGKSTPFDEFEANDRTYTQSSSILLPLLYNVTTGYKDEIVDNKIIIELSYDMTSNEFDDWGYLSHGEHTIRTVLYEDTTVEDYAYYQSLQDPIDWDYHEEITNWHVSTVHTSAQYDLDPAKIIFDETFNAPIRTVGEGRAIIGYLTIDLSDNTITFSTTEPTL